MCYYNGQKVSKTEFLKLLQLEKALKDFDFLNKELSTGFDYSLNAVVRPKEGEIDFDIVQMEWGFVPAYIRNREQLGKMRLGYKDSAGKFHPPLTTLNATAEEMLKPGKIYREAALKRRCLVLSSGFFEWRHVNPLSKKTGLPLKATINYPYHITIKEHEYFYMAGIWQPFIDTQTGETVDTFAIVTTKANPLMEQVHNSKKRMPTILPDELAYEWIFGELSEERIQQIGSYQYDYREMDACTISKEFRASLDPTAPFAYEDLPAFELSL